MALTKSLGGGGGGASVPEWITNHPNTPPASPTLFSGVAYDQEFGAAGYSLGGTTIGSPGTAPAIVDHSLKIVGKVNASFDIVGKEWACPGSAFTMWARTRRRPFFNAAWIFGIGLRANASGAGALTTLDSYNAGSGYGSVNIQHSQYSSLTARSAFSASGLGQALEIFLKIQYDGTNIIKSFSLSGYPDDFTQHSTETAASFLGGAPGRFLAFMDTNNASTAGIGYVDWIRFT